MLNEKDNIYLQQSELWRQVRAVLKGKYAVIDIVDCLPTPQYKNAFMYDDMTEQARINALRCQQQNTLRKQSYWARGRFFNATGRTHDSLDGMIWSKNPVVELPSRLAYIEDNADKTGCGLREVAQEVTDELIAIGRYGILVDMPNNNGINPTLAQMESGELAPKLIKYKAESIIYFRVAASGKSVDEVRLIEVVDVQSKTDNYKWEKKEFVRRLVMLDGVYTNELYDDKDNLISSSQPIANGSVMSEIPFQFFGADNNSPLYSRIPLYDLANVNLGHFVLDCDNRDNLHYHGQGMTVVSTDMDKEEFDQMNPNGLDVGAKGMNMLDANGKVEVIQLSATGAIPAEMERDEQRMIYLGAQLVQDSSSNQTLGAKEIDINASTATLKRIARNASDGLEQCLRWAGQFLGIDEEVIYQLNTQFVTDSMDAQMVAQHFQAIQASLLPKVTYYETARKAGLTELDDDELIELSLEDDLAAESQTEEVATIQAQLDAALEEIERLRNA